MKKLLIFLSVLVSLTVSGQLPIVSGFVNRNTKEQTLSSMAHDQLSPPADTTFTKLGYAIRAGISYYGNGVYWTAMTQQLIPLQDGATGCPVVWTGSGLIFTVGTPCHYNIAGVGYTLAAPVNVTLAAADPTNPRFDDIIVNTSSTATSVAGTAQTNPEIPTVDPASQLILTSVFVDAAATTPTQVGQVVVRDVNYAAGDWYMTRTATIDSIYATNPFHATLSVRLTAATGVQYFQYNARNNVPFSKSLYNTLIFYIRNNSVLNPARNLNVSLWNGVTQVGVSLNLTTYGYVKATTGSYRLVSIPMSAFTGADAFTGIRITNAGTGGTVDVQFDYVQLQSGVIPPPSGVTSVGAGFGLVSTPNPIISTGVLRADSNSIASRARVQKGIDSLGALIGTRDLQAVTDIGAITTHPITADNFIAFPTGPSDYVAALNYNTNSTNWEGALVLREWSTGNGHTITLQPVLDIGTSDITLKLHATGTDLIDTIANLADIRAATGSSAAPAGNFGNLQLNRNGVFAAAASDTLGYTTAAGLSIKNIISMPNGTLTAGGLYFNGTRYFTNYGGISDNVSIGSGAGSLAPASQNRQAVSIGSGAGTSNKSSGQVFIGLNAGNAFVGADSLIDIQNIFIGAGAGENATGGANNTSIGQGAGRSLVNGSFSNAFIGKVTGAGCTSCNANSFLGSSIAGSTFTGTYNAIVGSDAFFGPSNAYQNSGTGAYVLNAATTAHDNSVTGYHAGGACTTCQGNVFMGTYTGNNATNHVQSVFIGNFAGAYLSSTSARLVIETQNPGGTGTATIMGDFTQKRVGIGLAETASLANTLEVGGNTKTQGFVAGYVAKTTTYSVGATDYTIDCTSGTFTVTLISTASISTGQIFKVINTGAGVITVACSGGQTINGAATYSLASQYKYVEVQANGTNYIVTGNN